MCKSSDPFLQWKKHITHQIITESQPFAAEGTSWIRSRARPAELPSCFCGHCLSTCVGVRNKNESNAIHEWYLLQSINFYPAISSQFACACSFFTLWICNLRRSRCFDTTYPTGHFLTWTSDHSSWWLQPVPTLWVHKSSLGSQVGLKMTDSSKQYSCAFLCVKLPGFFCTRLHLSMPCAHCSPNDPRLTCANPGGSPFCLKGTKPLMA